MTAIVRPTSVTQTCRQGTTLRTSVDFPLPSARPTNRYFPAMAVTCSLIHG